VYNVNDWVDMLNTTLTNLTFQINNALATSINAPYVLYDLTTGLFTLYVSQLATANNLFKVFFNPSLYNVLPLPAIYAPIIGSSPLTYNYEVQIRNSVGNQSTALVNGTKVDFLSATTEFSPLSLLCPIRGIYFATNLLPIEPLLTTPPKVLTDATLTGANAGEPGITNILTDFQIAVTPQNNYNGEVSYLPAGEYRFIDLNQGVNLNKLDLSAFWKDKFGNSFPIYLPVGCSANIKLLFRNRKFYLGNNF
jgi:hypothetical protein